MTFHTRNTLTFTGAAGAGMVNTTTTLATVYGAVTIIDVVCYVDVTLLPDTGTMVFGPSELLGPARNVTQMTEGAMWTQDVLPAVGHMLLPSTPKVLWQSQSVTEHVDITLMPATTTITSGQITVDIWWEPISSNATLGGSRSKYVQPFPPDSIWNHPLMDSYVLVAAGIPNADGSSNSGDGFIGLDECILQIDYTALPLLQTRAYPQNPWVTPSVRCGPGNTNGPLVPWPSNWYVDADIGDRPNNPGVFVMGDGDTYYETQPIHRCSTGSYKRVTYRDGDLDAAQSLSTGDGIEGSHGGSNMSSIGGCIRLGELIPGGDMMHALGINLNAEQALALNDNGSAWTIVSNTAANPTVLTVTGHPFVSGETITIAGVSDAGVDGSRVVTRISANTFSVPVNSAGGTGGTAVRPYSVDYRWPATNDDTAAPGGSVPECRYGSLLCLAAAFDVDTLLTEPGKIIARTLKNYGAYVVDSIGSDPPSPMRAALCVERSPYGRVHDEFQQVWGYPMHFRWEQPLIAGGHTNWIADVHTILDNLKVVDNNTATTIGGGIVGAYGNPLAPWAAPLL